MGRKNADRAQGCRSRAKDADRAEMAQRTVTKMGAPRTVTKSKSFARLCFDFAQRRLLRAFPLIAAKAGPLGISASALRVDGLNQQESSDSCQGGVDVLQECVALEAVVDGPPEENGDDGRGERQQVVVGY